VRALHNIRGRGYGDQITLRQMLTHTSGLPAYTDANSLKTQYGCPCPEKRPM